MCIKGILFYLYSAKGIHMLQSPLTLTKLHKICEGEERSRSANTKGVFGKN